MKKAILLIMSALTLFALAACQATPAEEFVVKKDTERMVEQAGTQEEGTAVSSLAVPDGNYVFKAENKSGKVKINVDAGIVVPDVDNMPIARVGMGRFTQTDVENLYNILCADKTPVSGDNPLPKAYYRTILDELVKQKQSGRLDKYASMDELDAAINDMMKEIEQAPETAQEVTPDFSFVPILEGSEHVRLLNMLDNKVLSELFVTNYYENGDGRAVYLRDLNSVSAFSIQKVGGYGISDAYKETESENFTAPSIDERKAGEIADNIIERLQLSGFTRTGQRLTCIYNDNISENAERKGLYELMYTRSVNGASITYTNDDATFDSESAVAQSWGYEKIRVFVDDDGVFALIWNSPYTVDEVINENATLLPFDKITEIFEQMIVIMNEGLVDWDGSPVEKEINITEIRLGLMRVTEKDNNDYAVLVPVWDFFGTESRGESTLTLGLDGYQSLVTINAVDGSIIDREKGY